MLLIPQLLPFSLFIPPPPPPLLCGTDCGGFEVDTLSCWEKGYFATNSSFNHLLFYCPVHIGFEGSNNPIVTSIFYFCKEKSIFHARSSLFNHHQFMMILRDPQSVQHPQSVQLPFSQQEMDFTCLTHHLATYYYVAQFAVVWTGPLFCRWPGLVPGSLWLWHCSSLHCPALGLCCFYGGRGDTCLLPAPDWLPDSAGLTVKHKKQQEYVCTAYTLCK